MKSTVFGLGVCFVASALLWTGCSGGTTQNDIPDGGGTPEGSSNDSGPTSDAAPADTGTDSAAPPLTGPFIDIKYGAASCPAFTACGGDPKGMWTLKDGCVTEKVFDGAKAQCNGLTESDVKFQARGYVLVDATSATQKTEVKFSAKLAVPSGCKGLAGGVCANLATLLQTLGGLDTATCVDDAGTGGCTCDVGDTITDTTTDTYTTSGNTLTTGSGGSARTWDYCVASPQLSLKETTQDAVPALFILQK